LAAAEVACHEDALLQWHDCVECPVRGCYAWASFYADTSNYLACCVLVRVPAGLCCRLVCCCPQGRAYEYGLETLRQQGVPVDGLRFDPGLVIRGLIMDKEYGNLIKVDRFG
jgi:hypothetical protein